MQRKIALPGDSRCNLYIGSFLRPESVTQSIEKLPLREAADPGGDIGCDVFRACHECTDEENLGRVTSAIQPPLGGWIRSTAMTIPAAVRDDEEAATSNFIFGRGRRTRRAAGE